MAQLKRRAAVAAIGLMLAAPATAQIPIRTAIAAFPIAEGKAVSRVETTRVDFLPGQTMPVHMHPVPVVCFVSKGAFRVRIGDEPERTVPLGAATYEPPGVTIHYFTNASTAEPAQLFCAALAGQDDKVISVMLDPEKTR